MVNHSNKENDNAELCQNCKYWQLAIANPQSNIGLGICHNDQHEEAPYGAVLGHFASCAGFEQKEKQVIVKPTKKIANIAGKRF